MRLATIFALSVIAVDQASKWFVVAGLRLDEQLFIEVVPGVFNLTMAWNRGVNFGLFASDSPWLRWGLVGLALAISAWIWLWARREAGNIWMQASAGVLVGGALGNVIDRLVWGAVADFINLTCCGIANPYAFNIADGAIFIGAIGLILFSGRKSPRDGNGDLL